MKVYRLTTRKPHRLSRLIGYYTSFETAVNAAEIHAEAAFEVDDVQFDFPVIYGGDDLKQVNTQFYPPREGATWSDPRGDYLATYSIQHIEVHEEAQ